MVRALVDHPDLATAEPFEAGVEPENVASRRTLDAAGFRPRSLDPDCEGMPLYYELRASVSRTHASGG